jgi:glutamine amidotransferase
VARTDYGRPFASIIAHNNIFGIQFHPEKSQQRGLQILSNYLALT